MTPLVEAVAALLADGPWILDPPDPDAWGARWTLRYTGTDPEALGQAIRITESAGRRFAVSGETWVPTPTSRVNLLPLFGTHEAIRDGLVKQITLSAQQPAATLAKAITTRFLQPYRGAWHEGIQRCHAAEVARADLNAYMTELATILQATDRLQLSTASGTEATVNTYHSPIPVHATFRAAGQSVRLEYLTLTRAQALAVATVLASFTEPERI